MNYSSVVREIHNRLRFHSKPEGILHGLKIRESGEFKINGEDDLPHFVFVDIQTNDTKGLGTGTISSWLRVARRRSWFIKEGESPNGVEAHYGLLDWMVLVMDAVETKPSDGASDQMLIAHDEFGRILPGLNGEALELLTEPFQWNTQMDEISDLCFTMQMNLSFSLPTAKRANRRLLPKLKPLLLRTEE
jgi:hypothetical protein